MSTVVLAMVNDGNDRHDGQPNPCPPSCTEIHESGTAEVLHMHDSDRVWGETPARFGEPKLGAYLERLDDEDGSGTPHVGVQASATGTAVNIDITMSLDVAEDFIAELQRLVALGRKWKAHG